MSSNILYFLKRQVIIIIIISKKNRKNIIFVRQMLSAICIYSPDGRKDSRNIQIRNVEQLHNLVHNVLKHLIQSL